MQQICFQIEQEADGFLQTYIGQIPNISVEKSRLLANNIKNEIKHLDFSNSDDKALSFIIPKFNYVIKNEDLPILESLFDGLKTAAGADFFMKASSGNANTMWAAAIGIFSTLFKLYKNLKNKGKTVTSRQFQILMALNNYPEGLELGFIKLILEPHNVELTEEQLQHDLEELGEIYTNDGSKRQLVILEKNLYRSIGI